MLWAITSAGRFTRAMHCAMVNVLPGAGDAEQDLGRVAPLQALDELVDRAALIAAQLEVRDQFEAIVLGSHSVAVQWRLAKRTRNAHRTTAAGSVRTGRGRRRIAGLPTRPGDQRVGASLYGA